MGVLGYLLPKRSRTAFFFLLEFQIGTHARGVRAKAKQNVNPDDGQVLADQTFILSTVSESKFSKLPKLEINKKKKRKAPVMPKRKKKRKERTQHVHVLHCFSPDLKVKPC